MKHGLLSAADECSLSKQFKLSSHVQAQSKLMSMELGYEVSNAELAAVLQIPEEHVPIILEKGENAKKILVNANLRLVFHIARYYRYRGVAYPDLVQEGTFGLIKAIDKFDPERGFRFSTYASWWIKQAVSRAIAEKSRIVRLPVHIHDLMVSISRVEKQFISSHSRKPTPYELAERLCLPLQKVELLLKCARDVRSIDEDIYQNKGKGASNNQIQVKDRIASKETEPSYINERNSLREELRRAMKILSEREAQIVEMRFGLTDGNQMTLEEIGKLFNVTRERIRQIEARALSKMRNPLKADEMKEIFQDQSFFTPPTISSIPTLTQVPVIQHSNQQSTQISSGSSLINDKIKATVN